MPLSSSVCHMRMRRRPETIVTRQTPKHDGWVLTSDISLIHKPPQLGLSQISDTFGPGTFAALKAQFPLVSSATTNPRVVGILQCALWAKGYVGGYTSTSAWDGDVSASVLKLRGDLGGC